LEYWNLKIYMCLLTLVKFMYSCSNHLLPMSFDSFCIRTGYSTRDSWRIYPKMHHFDLNEFTMQRCIISISRWIYAGQCPVFSNNIFLLYVLLHIHCMYAPELHALWMFLLPNLFYHYYSYYFFLLCHRTLHLIFALRNQLF
jgi:hypothetical protein